MMKRAALLPNITPNERCEGGKTTKKSACLTIPGGKEGDAPTLKGEPQDSASARMGRSKLLLECEKGGEAGGVAPPVDHQKPSSLERTSWTHCLSTAKEPPRPVGRGGSFALSFGLCM
jgi:hypothetical protein